MILAVVPGRKIGVAPHPAAFAQAAASLKHKVKAASEPTRRSSYVIEQRDYTRGVNSTAGKENLIQLYPLR